MTTKHDDGNWDAVVIGSGIGGLSAAVLLAKLHGKRVLVLERHYRAGGYTHTFTRRGGHRWDVGVHYVGGMGEGDEERDLFDVITGAEVAWARMPEGFDRLIFPDFEFTVRAGKERFREDLKAAFPAEARAIDRYLDDVERAASYMNVIGMRAAAPAPIAALADFFSPRARKLALGTTSACLDKHFSDPRLKSILGARWGDYGLPPAQGAFLAHAIITKHYFEGAYYPVGSSASIAAAATRVLASSGGEVRIRAEVERILVEGGRAVGVKLANGKEIRAPLVISDAGARNTYLRLLPSDLPLSFRDDLRATPPSARFVSLFLGLSESPEKLGVHGENLWIHGGIDQDDLARQAASAMDGKPSMAVAFFPSLKDPAAKTHTMEILTLVDDEAFRRWEGTRWMKRGEDYEALKDRIADGLLAMVERHLPGLGALVEHKELGTPLSAENFTAHFRGESYGLPVTPDRFQKRHLSARTPVPGLFLTGADALMLGVVGAARAGQMCAAAALGPAALFKLGAEARRARDARRATPVETSPSIA